MSRPNPGILYLARGGAMVIGLGAVAAVVIVVVIVLARRRAWGGTSTRS